MNTLNLNDYGLWTQNRRAKWIAPRLKYITEDERSYDRFRGMWCDVHQDTFPVNVPDIVHYCYGYIGCYYINWRICPECWEKIMEYRALVDSSIAEELRRRQASEFSKSMQAFRDRIKLISRIRSP